LPCSRQNQSNHAPALSLLSDPKCVAVNWGSEAGNSVIEAIRAFYPAAASKKGNVPEAVLTNRELRRPR
jgi:hypothetical protein